jgi:hypothetical protein
LVSRSDLGYPLQRCLIFLKKRGNHVCENLNLLALHFILRVHGYQNRLVYSLNLNLEVPRHLLPIRSVANFVKKFQCLERADRNLTHWINVVFTQVGALRSASFARILTVIVQNRIREHTVANLDIQICYLSPLVVLHALYRVYNFRRSFWHGEETLLILNLRQNRSGAGSKFLLDHIHRYMEFLPAIIKPLLQELFQPEFFHGLCVHGHKTLCPRP